VYRIEKNSEFIMSAIYSTVYILFFNGLRINLGGAILNSLEFKILA